jgi:hypothetical protein
MIIHINDTIYDFHGTGSFNEPYRITEEHLEFLDYFLPILVDERLNNNYQRVDFDIVSGGDNATCVFIYQKPMWYPLLDKCNIEKKSLKQIYLLVNGLDEE